MARSWKEVRKDAVRLGVRRRRLDLVGRRRLVSEYRELQKLPRLSKTKLIPFDRYTPWSLFETCPVCGAGMKMKCHKNRKGGGKTLDRPHQERVSLAQRIVAPMVIPSGEFLDSDWERELLGENP